MNQFNLGNFLNNFINYSLQNKGGSSPAPQGPGEAKFLIPQENMPTGSMPKVILPPRTLNALNPSMINNLKMNNFANFERSLYLKDLMNLPKEMEEILVVLQNKETTVAKEALKLLNKGIDVSVLAELIQTNGKEAMNKLILTMANASKQGITDLSEMKDAMKLINASIAVAGQPDNASHILKNFMLLYLPWLPLQEGVDFDLEIESFDGAEEGEGETTVTIMISTKNYGNVRVMLILSKGNNINIIVNCSDNFPKDELLKRLESESKNHSIKSEIIFEHQEMKQDKNTERQAKVSMSNSTQINPFLLLMTNAVIRHAIDLDNQTL